MESYSIAWLVVPVIPGSVPMLPTGYPIEFLSLDGGHL